MKQALRWAFVLVVFGIFLVSGVALAQPGHHRRGPHHRGGHHCHQRCEEAYRCHEQCRDRHHRGRHHCMQRCEENKANCKAGCR